jgi:hypothetical protein
VAVAVAQWQWRGGSGGVAVAQWQWGNGLQNDPKMSRIGALLAEIWMIFHKSGSGCGCGWVAVDGWQWMGGSGKNA